MTVNQWRGDPRRGRFLSWAKAHRVALLVVALAVALLIPAGGSLSPLRGSSDDLPRRLRPEHTITFAASGDASGADMTYSADETRDVTLLRDTALPWRLDVKVKSGPRTSYQLSVAANANGGSVTCEIRVDRTRVQLHRASGTDATASCQYTP